MGVGVAVTVGGVMGLASNAGLSSCLWDGCVHSHVLFIDFLLKMLCYTCSFLLLHHCLTYMTCSFV